jgi:hypothetical protein
MKVWKGILQNPEGLAWMQYGWFWASTCPKEPVNGANSWSSEVSKQLFKESSVKLRAVRSWVKGEIRSHSSQLMQELQTGSFGPSDDQWVIFKLILEVYNCIKLSSLLTSKIYGTSDSTWNNLTRLYLTVCNVTCIQISENGTSQHPEIFQAN